MEGSEWRGLEGSEWRGLEGPAAPLISGKKTKKITKERKAGRADKTPPTPFSSPFCYLEWVLVLLVVFLLP